MHDATWPLWQRLSFRFLFCYYVLNAFPGPLNKLYGLFLPGFLGRWWWTFNGWMDRGWQALTTWCDHRGWAPYEVIHQQTGSGDTGHAFAQLFVIVLLSVMATIMWSLLQRGRAGHPLLGRWLHLVVRFDLAFTLLGYGSAKLYGSQFGEMGLDRLTQEIGDTWPMTMVGTFMKAYPPYEVFGGVGEVLAALLLFHHRTALLGAFVTIGVMTNVCALNWLCGVPVKLFSAHLLLEGMLLLLPYRNSLWAVFVRNRPSTPVDLSVVQAFWPRIVLLVLGSLWVGAVLVHTHLGGVEEDPRMRAFAKSELYGVWLVDKMVLDGAEVPVSDATRWSFLAIDRGSVAWTRDATGQRRWFDFAWDPATGIVQVAERASRREKSTAAPSPWSCERGTTITKVDPPELLRIEQRGTKVDGERGTLVFKGKLGDKQLELHTIEKRFRLQSAFRLRQELPDFW